ncbi:MarR family transcriptional regulator [Kitasatospora sp. NPDC049285]|uniref:MarR family winged helix-turn-helix transcriptional regulator n=1 Tax=Kitasatospora sp. NPDC049285 TaxID=3157096 RepID=UPI00341BA68D
MKPKQTPEVAESAVQAAQDTWAVVGRLRRRLRGIAVEGDLTPGQVAVLRHLDQAGPDSTSGLAAAERMRPQSMAKIVAALELSGLVERSPDPADGRRQLVALTPAGRERRAGDRRARQEWLALALSERCTEEERRAVVTAMAVLDRVAQL